MENNKKQTLKQSKQIVLNSRKINLKYSSEVRLIVARNGQVFFLVHDEPNKKFYVFNALTLENNGYLRYNIKKIDNKKFGEVIEIQLDKSIQKQGVGTKLMKYAEHCLKKQGVNQIELFASRSRANTSTKVLEKWYSNLGYMQKPVEGILLTKFIKKPIKYSKSKQTKLLDVIPQSHQKKLTKIYFSFLKNRTKKLISVELNRTFK